MYERSYIYEFTDQYHDKSEKSHPDSYGSFWSYPIAGRVTTADGSKGFKAPWDLGLSGGSTIFVLGQAKEAFTKSAPDTVTIEINGKSVILKRNYSITERASYYADGDVFNLSHLVGTKMSAKINW